MPDEYLKKSDMRTLCYELLLEHLPNFILITSNLKV